MEAVKMAVGNGAHAARDSADATHHSSDEAALAPRMKAALAALLEALEYAQDLDGSPWDFAIEIASMRRLKLSTSDVRWLVARGLVKHALEVTPPRDSVRSFRRPERPVFGKKSCFVLTPAGAEVARELRRSQDSLPNRERHATSNGVLPERAAPPQPAAPKWDRDRRELRVGSVVVKQFKIPSAGQEALLAAFEETSWASRIDDPLAAGDGPSGQAALQEVINRLNTSQKRPLVRFLADGDGHCVRWEFCGGPAGPGDA